VTVYVDTMRAPYGRMIMCHLIADTEAELLEMVDKIGLNRKWHQHPGTYRSHFDVALVMRRRAVKHGAVEITIRELGEKLRARRAAIAARMLQ
jgi:hypothetical protein